jgi:hypothetical protein
MFGSCDSVYAAEAHLRYLHDVVIPRGERRRAIEQQLTTLATAQPGSTGRGLTTWLGMRLVRAGEWLQSGVPSAEVCT